MPNNATAATVVGNKFAFEYYTTLSENPQNISTYYKMESALTTGVGSFDVKDNSDGDHVETLFGTQNIEKKINAMKFAGCKVIISNINCQESLNGGVIVVVLGNIALKANDTLQTPRAFAQTFFLGVQTEPVYSYYVLNDIFTFVNVNVAPSTTHAFSLPKSVPTPVHTLNFTVASNNVIPHNVNPPKVHVEPSPIPAPQSTPPPQVVHQQPNSQPVQPVQQLAPQPVVTKQPDTTPIVHSTPAPTTETPATNNATQAPGSQEKPKKEKKNHNNANNANNTDSPRASSEWKQIGKRPQNRPNKTPRRRDNNDGEHKGEHKNDQKEHKEHKGEHKNDQKEHKDDNKKRERRDNNNRQNSRRQQHDKKPENHETNNTSDKQTNGTESVSSNANSWAKIAVVGATKAPDSPNVAVFKPAPIVYTPQPVAQTEPEKVEKVVEKKEKPKKDRKKEVDPIKLARKKTKELRTVRVSNLPYEVTDDVVKKHFSTFGDIVDIVLRNGYGYVEYDSVTGVTNILNAIKREKLFLGGRELKIEPRQPKQSQEPDKPFYKEEKKADTPTSPPSVPATTSS